MQSLFFLTSVTMLVKCEKQPITAMSKSILPKENRPVVDGDKNRRLYLARLQEQGLPIECSSNEQKQPSQFQVTQVAAILSSGAENSNGSSELALRAVELWYASGNALRVNGQAELVANGLLYYHQDDWRKHAYSLVSLLDNSRPLPPLDETQETDQKKRIMAFREASNRVTDAWLRKRVRPDGFLKALFPGKRETEVSRLKKFFDLVEYGKEILRDRSTWLAYQGKSDPIILRDLIRDAWRPFILPPAAPMGKEEEDTIFETRQAMDDPKKILGIFGVWFEPFVARWFVDLRFQQLAEGKTRINRGRMMKDL